MYTIGKHIAYLQVLESNTFPYTLTIQIKMTTVNPR